MRNILLLGILILVSLGCSKLNEKVIFSELIEVPFAYIPELDKLTKLTPLSIREETGYGINGISTDGDDLYALHYTGESKLLKFDFNSSSWEYVDNHKLNQAINRISGAYQSPGGLSMNGDTLWISDSYGSSYGAILKSTNEEIYRHRIKLRNQSASQLYAGIEYNYPYVYMAYHTLKAEDENDHQTLLKFDTRTKELVSQSTLLSDSHQYDGVHGLTISDNVMWHVRRNRLSLINPEIGSIIKTYALQGIYRPSGITYLDSTLYIVSFDGDLFSLPLK